ncbi:S9 family peptidase [Bifidobacterium choloepi]|uniref:S9 family peptidase n=1 Tax=Bifidobacterium choloepi TaxID=2614131 RepID=A0A6I5N3X8_9BIFI|nr:prolyl oligopeptidase family serine peptidase [Bifidobacterium choloepi]NEG70379.1 S9 family peptidase [Bifidobacterium choloepi]
MTEESFEQGESFDNIAVPTAVRRPSERRFHGDVFVDDYEWLRDKNAAETKRFVDEENRYCESRMAPLAGLQRTLFDEFRSHVQETDMSVPTRMDDYWYFTRTQEGKQYAVQCRLPIAGPDDWTPPAVSASDAPGSMPGEEIVFDANREAEGHEFFRVGGMDLTKDGRWLLYGVDTDGDERYDYRIRDLATGRELDERFDGISGACFTPDGRYVFYTELDDAWRPWRIRRHRVGSGTPADEDAIVFTEDDEHFWAGVGMSFDERSVVIGTGSKTTTEVLMLPVADPEGDFSVFIPRQEGVEYDVSFACFEGGDGGNDARDGNDLRDEGERAGAGASVNAGAGAGGARGGDGAVAGAISGSATGVTATAAEHSDDIPVAIVYHNATNPNFEIDVIDLRDHQPPFRLGEGVRVVAGSPYGCEEGDRCEPGASARPISTPVNDPVNPAILQGCTGLAIEGIAMHRHYVAMSYRADGLPRLAVMPKSVAREDFLAGRPWEFRELVPPELAPAQSPLSETAEAAEAEEAVAPGEGVEPGGVTATREADGHEAARSAAPDSPDGMCADESCQILPAQLEATVGRLYSIGNGGNPSYDAPRLRYSFSSFTRPAELHELDVATDADTLLKVANVLGGFDARDYREARAWVTARDGERIPVSLVWRKGAVLRDMPMFILGYGAYEISSDPGFSVARLSLLDRGVLYALPHVRGGGEMGRAWYEQGRRLNKKNTFADFVDVTAALQNCGLADAGRTVANGGSAGGLLMGAIANMAPDRYAGIEADVPFVDALTTILDPSLPLTITEWDEWGDPLHDAEVYRYMKTYSPYENAPAPRTVEEADVSDGGVPECAECSECPNGEDRVADGEPSYRWPDGRVTHAFPKIFVTTSMNDTRVMVVEPLKWIARLQAAGVDAVIRIEGEAGHGGTSGRYRQWEQISYENAWCLATMGITE